MDYSSLMELTVCTAVLGTAPLWFPEIVYPLYRRDAVSDFSKSCGIDASRLDKEHTAKIWLTLFQPSLIPLRPKHQLSPELEEVVKGFRNNLPTVHGKEVRYAALDKMLQNPLVREYVLKP